MAPTIAHTLREPADLRTIGTTAARRRRGVRHKHLAVRRPTHKPGNRGRLSRVRTPTCRASPPRPRGHAGSMVRSAARGGRKDPMRTNTQPVPQARVTGDPALAYVTDEADRSVIAEACVKLGLTVVAQADGTSVDGEPVPLATPLAAVASGDRT